MASFYVHIHMLSLLVQLDTLFETNVHIIVLKFNAILLCYKKSFPFTGILDKSDCSLTSINRLSTFWCTMGFISLRMHKETSRVEESQIPCFLLDLYRNLCIDIMLYYTPFFKLNFH